MRTNRATHTHTHAHTHTPQMMYSCTSRTAGSSCCRDRNSATMAELMRLCTSVATLSGVATARTRVNTVARTCPMAATAPCLNRTTRDPVSWLAFNVTRLRSKALTDDAGSDAVQQVPHVRWDSHAVTHTHAVRMGGVPNDNMGQAHTHMRCTHTWQRLPGR